MKKLGLMILVAGIILMAGCAGDDPAGPSGTLADVTGLAIGSSSAGRDVVLSWTAVSDVDGYYVYFRATTTADWTQVGDVTGTTYTHTASSAGYYTAKAYKGSDTSTNNSNVEDTMPFESSTYTIYDNFSAAT
ncbi:MAG: fibronectin type III domain-containing protein, partial [Candidatus Aegiribacteria sp.]|nr:fibronectin type III domain-containing protein [Candidatus Aegiribacteria sp.]